MARHTLSIGFDTETETWAPASPGGRLIEAAGKGAPQSVACDYAGISPRALQQWRATWNSLESGKKHTVGEARIVRFFRLYDEAAAALTVDLLDSWTQQAKTGDWRASLALLSRRYPVDFGDPTKRLELSGPDGGPVVLLTNGVIADAVNRARVDAE